MSVYIIIEAKTKDADSYSRYIERVSPIIVKHGGRYHVRSSEVTPGAGGWAPERLIVVEFPSREHLERCFASPEYQEIKPFRDAGADFRSVVVDGYKPGEPWQAHG